MAEYNLAPVSYVSCIDQTTRVLCSAALDTQTFTTDAYVTYPTPDTTAPLITLNGSGTVQMEAGGGFYDEGAEWLDNRAGTGFINFNSGTLDGNVLGTYILGYTYTDPSGNTGTPVQRTVEVVDTTAPALQLIGSGTIIFELDEYFPDYDAGATWTDHVDGHGTVYSDTTFSSTGIFDAEYIYVDSSGNTGSISRTVNVVDTLPPSMSIFSENTTLSANKFFLEGNTYGAETLRVTGGLNTLTGSFDENGDFSLLVPLTQNAINTLVVEARDASGNIATGSVVVTQNTALSSFSGAAQVNGNDISKASQITGT